MDNKWLVKLGEGLIIGFGIAIALSIYSSMVNATDALNGARKIFDKQVKINKDLSSITKQTSREILSIDNSQNDIYTKIELLSKKVKLIEKAVKEKSTTNLNLRGFDWKKFDSKKRVSLPSTSNEVELPKLPESKSKSFINLQNTIQQQQAIPFK